MAAFVTAFLAALDVDFLIYNQPVAPLFLKLKAASMTASMTGFLAGCKIFGSPHLF
jgi:hypothetical protein